MADKDIEEIARILIDAAIKVHRALEPGLLESVYQICLAHELRRRGLGVECEVPQTVEYDGLLLETGYLGFLLNWHVVLMKHGIKRMIL